MRDIPWRESASLIRTSRNPVTQELLREVVFEGSLTTVVARLARMSGETLPHLIVTLPDRGVRPFRYTLADFAELILEHKILLARSKG